jgi:uncharacterized phiE125 gp8 family phage protein
MRQIDEWPLPVAVALADARSFLRLGGGNDDAVLSAALVSATQLCEQFTGLALVSRTVREILPVTDAWQRLGRSPVLAITLVEGVPAEGSLFPLPVSAYGIDIDAGGDGWVRVSQPGAAGRLRITYTAGMAVDFVDVPEALRHGIIQLAGHLLRERDRERGVEPPASVAALWRPWRRLRIAMPVREGQA